MLTVHLLKAFLCSSPFVPIFIYFFVFCLFCGGPGVTNAFAGGSFISFALLGKNDVTANSPKPVSVIGRCISMDRMKKRKRNDTKNDIKSDNQNREKKNSWSVRCFSEPCDRFFLFIFFLKDGRESRVFKAGTTSNRQPQASQPTNQPKQPRETEALSFLSNFSHGIGVYFPPTKTRGRTAINAD